ncbi:MAG: glutamate-1-semialdehyde-2,1-aminomutase [SAR86 cluster bacterium]|uniref:Glutamate-1-semialdehyde 2,1-aminomutase n=1 Tax=SAR86 cluster bacterium TaxID=2030880 RepID=A0A520MUH2_9GAMM|nr:MAG: glutamate-1-semialdehyde-2,1-aminomutase [SAR86 cluster bacterium]
MKTKNSQELFEKSKKHIAGGVNSPVRAFKSVGGSPIFFKKSRGCYLYDEDGNKYLDFVGSWGPMVLGHSNKNIINAIKNQASKGISFGAPTKNELEIAKIIKSYLPSIEKLRMVNSGTEATMSCIRLARGTTNRKKIIKFIGCYHGHVDSLLVKAGSGLATLGVPDSPGIPEELSELTITLPYNDIDSLKDAFSKFSNDIAAVIIEPIAGNMGFIEPEKKFLEHLRDICSKNETILIFDEVMTGFRVARGGVQELFDITPDLTALGKIVGGGLPVGVYGGKAEIMNNISPDGPVYQAGTLSGNPIAVSAGTALLKQLSNKNIYANMENNAKIFLETVNQAAKRLDIPFSYNARGGMFGFFFSDELPRNFDDVQNSNIEFFSKFFRKMLDKNIYLPPSAYESCFISTEHDEEKMLKAARIAELSLEEIKNEI